MHEQKTVQDKVISAIEAGRVKMRPRWHFVLRAALFAIGGIMLLLALVYLASFIIFAVRQTGAAVVPRFGSTGWREFFGALPWVLIGLAALFALVLEVLVRRYAFAYRRPLLATLLGIVLLVAAGGIVLAKTPLHRILFESARQGNLPVAGPFYRQFGLERLPNIHRGTILTLVPGGFVMRYWGGETTTVAVTPQTLLPHQHDLVPGEGVVVFGPEDERMGRIRAVGIEEVEAEPAPDGDAGPTSSPPAPPVK